MSLAQEVHYTSLRGDWIRGVDLLVRLIRQSAIGERVLIGFPRQWIPIFIYFRCLWRNSANPDRYIPVVSHCNEAQLREMSESASRHGTLRELVESFASLDPLLADVLYRIDRHRLAESSNSSVLLTGWQSYGRPEIVEFCQGVQTTASASSSTAVLLPCARKRPYGQSKTHRRIWKHLAEMEVEPSQVDQIVVSSIGIVPEFHWDHPVVHAYDSGVPDIYRILRLMRLFFGKVRYSTVVDCLEFRPYSDCLQIVAREGLVGEVRLGTSRRTRSLPFP